MLDTTEDTRMDITRYLNRGRWLIAESGDGRQKVTSAGAIWALLREAAAVSGTWGAVPRSGYPSTSPGFNGPDTATEWDRARNAFEEGITVTQMYGTKPRPQFTAEQHDQAVFTLRLFHDQAFKMSGARVKLRAAVYEHAKGMPPRKVRAATGMDRHQLQRAKERACEDMLAALEGGWRE
jgi:hypothetical protein